MSYFRYAYIKGMEKSTISDFDYVENIPLKEFWVYYYYLGIQPIKVHTIPSGDVWSYVNEKLKQIDEMNKINPRQRYRATYKPEPEDLVHQYMVIQIFMLIQSN